MVRTLSNAIATGRIAHAFMLTGCARPSARRRRRALLTRAR